MKFLGVKFLGHDSAFALLDTESKKVFAMSTERVTRIKHDWIDVSQALDVLDITEFDYCCHSFADFSCLSDTAGWTVFDNEKSLALREMVKPLYIKDLILTKREKNFVMFKNLFSNPKLFFRYQYYKYMAKRARRMYADNASYHRKTMLEYTARKLKIDTARVSFHDHHLCHAAAAYYLSPYVGQTVLSLTLDGQGDGSFSKAFIFGPDKYELVGNSPACLVSIDGREFFTSIGELYGNFTEALGLRRFSDEGKVEAMAAYATHDADTYSELKKSVKFIDNGISFDEKIIKPFYDIDHLRVLANELGDKVFSATIQTFLQDLAVDYLNLIAAQFPHLNTLCLSGGVAANIIMSLNIYERTPFKNIYVLPPMGDEGTALGSAILGAKAHGIDVSWLNVKHMPYYGDEISQGSIKLAISKFASKINSEYLGEYWQESAARSVADGKVVALVNGCMEFGPRALGNRSIVANPSLNEIRDRINATVKRRPSYQPFCPSILEEERERLFYNSFPHKHMAIAFRMRKEFHSSLPSAIHVDGTARPQFVEVEDNSEYYKFLVEVKKATGFGVVLNTSFNLHGRTMVRTANDAFTDFLDCNLDYLYICGWKISRANLT